MLDWGRPLSLWGSWWIAIQLLRPAFSRLSTFMWFATIVAGITVRTDTLGVTSIVRALNPRPKLYHRLLAHFHSTGVKLDRLAALWAQVVLGLYLEVRVGVVVALMGRNGAGKSATLKSIMGLIPGARGDIRFDGQPLSGLEAFQIARLGLGYVPEERRIFTDLTVLENLEVGRQAPRAAVPPWDADKVLHLFPNLRELKHRLGGQMSGGEQQMLTVARTLMGNPRLVLLDEPSEGIAPKIVEDIANTIVELKQEGLSVLLCEQNLHFAELVSDRAYVIEKGQVKYQGTMAELAANQEVKREYLAL